MKKEFEGVTVQYGIDRNTKDPVIVLTKGEENFAAFSVAQARNFANDIVQACARAESDAMIHQFFDKKNFPEGAAEALMYEFRVFRMKLDSELVEKAILRPNLNKDDTDKLN